VLSQNSSTSPGSVLFSFVGVFLSCVIWWISLHFSLVRFLSLESVRSLCVCVLLDATFLALSFLPLPPFPFHSLPFVGFDSHVFFHSFGTLAMFCSGS